MQILSKILLYGVIWRIMVNCTEYFDSQEKNES